MQNAQRNANKREEFEIVNDLFVAMTNKQLESSALEVYLIANKGEMSERETSEVVDALWLLSIEAETNKQLKDILVKSLSNIVKNDLLPIALLKERLEPDFLQALSLIRNQTTFSRKLIRLNTKNLFVVSLHSFHPFSSSFNSFYKIRMNISIIITSIMMEVITIIIIIIIRVMITKVIIMNEQMKEGNNIIVTNQMIKKRYTQQKYNLFREETEGYAKLIEILNSNDPDRFNLDVLRSLIG